MGLFNTQSVDNTADILLSLLLFHRWDQRGYSDKEIWEKAGSCGMLAINIPEEHGGIGGSFADASIVIEEV